MNDQHPILFTGEMVRAILAGRKTQTRRLVNRPAMASEQSFSDGMKYAKEHGLAGVQKVGPCDGVEWRCKCPYGVPGDLLWVREAWAMIGDNPQDAFACPNGVYFRADTCPSDQLRWRPSIHMPRWASRITLLVTGVRIERVQDITPSDAEAEGCWLTPEGRGHYSVDPPEFRSLWDAINAKRGAGWDANPWVWVVEFKVAALLEEGDRETHAQK